MLGMITTAFVPGAPAASAVQFCNQADNAVVESANDPSCSAQ